MITQSGNLSVEQERNAAPGGQDQVENDDLGDNLQDADTLADLADPRIDSLGGNEEDSTQMDNYSDGDRQLTTNSDALDTGLNDSDLGAEAAGLDPKRERYAAGSTETSMSNEEREGMAGLGPDTAPTGGEDRTGDRATGLGTGVRE